MDQRLLGLHHVTAIASDPQVNINFYTRVLGLRLVKVTVNFDDPSSYHFYYGDGVGTPGTIMTFFSWPDAPGGRMGSGQINATGFTIPLSSLAYWIDRLTTKQIAFTGPTRRFDEQVLALHDPDGLPIELVAYRTNDPRVGWDGSEIPAEHAIRGLHAVTLWEDRPERTAQLLTQTLGFQKIGEDGPVARYALGDGVPGTFADIRDTAGFWGGAVAVGNVHHVAWRTPSAADQLVWREELIQARQQVTPVMDRQYFHSIYFREAGGVLFEIATDPPGFMTDETRATLGTQLRLPPWLERQRAAISTSLPPIIYPEVRQ